MASQTDTQDPGLQQVRNTLYGELAQGTPRVPVDSSFFALNPPTGKIYDTGGEVINIVGSRYGCDPTGLTASDTGMALAISDAIAIGAGSAIITGPPGIYLFNNKILISPAASATAYANVPSIVFESSASRLGDSSPDVSPVEFRASGTFPTGEFLLDVIPATGGDSNALMGGKFVGFGLKCVSRAAGVRFANPRRFRVSDIVVERAATPAPADNRGLPTGAFNNVVISGTPTAFSQFDNITVSYAGKDSFVHIGQGSDIYLGCQSFNPVRYNYYINGASKWFGPHYETGTYGFAVQAGNNGCQIHCPDYFGIPTSGAVLLFAGSGGTGFPVQFIGGWYTNNPAASPGEEAGSIVQVTKVGSNAVKAVFDGCYFLSNTNTTRFVYVEAAVPAGSQVAFRASHFQGSPSFGQFNDASTAAALSFVGCPGINPTGWTFAPVVPNSNTYANNTSGTDQMVYLAGFTMTAVFVATGLAGGGAKNLGVPTAVLVPAGGSIAITYTVAGTWLWFGN